jgi:hypothetical protein
VQGWGVVKTTSSARNACGVAAALAATIGCQGNAVQYPDVAQVESRVLLERDNVAVRNGGYGSAAAAVPGRPGFLYLLVDRGPNVDTVNGDEKAFLLPEFAPHIGLFELDGAVLKRVAVVEMKDSAGQRFSGLPNAGGDADAIEQAVAPDGKPLPRDPNGVDTEGMAALPDGSFWIGDEYGPYLLHLDASGRESERLSPFEKNPQGRALPRVLARRRLNYGIEGLAATPDGMLLIAAMQSALDNPSRDVRAATRSTRLITLNPQDGATRQFVYLRERPEHSVTDIAALSATVFLVIERDDGFASDPARPARHKRIYRVDVARATDVSDADDGEGGRLFGGRTVEQLSDSQLAAAGITPAAKTLVVDLLALESGYPHDKPEGLVVMDGRFLAVANDDDFGIDNDSQGRVVPKTIPGIDRLDRNEVYFIPVDGLR